MFHCCEVHPCQCSVRLCWATCCSALDSYTLMFSNNPPYFHEQAGLMLNSNLQMGILTLSGLARRGPKGSCLSHILAHPLMRLHPMMLMVHMMLSYQTWHLCSSCKPSCRFVPCCCMAPEKRCFSVYLQCKGRVYNFLSVIPSHRLVMASHQHSL